MSEVRFENGKRVIQRWDRVFRAASAEPRRQLIVSLLDVDEGDTVALPESALNPNVPVDPKALRQELYHTHLPMLSSMEFVEWSTEPFVASRGSRFGEVAAVFEALHSQASAVPDSLVVGCQRLECERQLDADD
ncbi:hypothetical protein [Natrarchaeobius oligotrophus]|uniref:ArsR family transcriptional regulator n=1 Tax=Natrarchaeobius chitinivorans TaxID=1679083 RepID=A0A3N6MKN8_NATCH|nr:hypothetical protein [Natrarchaeobius chitinivorans]RQH01965.1 hypothetical protein EA472_06585 [Natrarchaeobius chitinivorans]